MMIRMPRNANRIGVMGLTHVKTTLRSLSGKGKPFEADFLVDTGSVDCMAPSDKLVAAGIKPERKRKYELASGETVEYECGFARVAFNGDETVAQVIFGPPGVEPILGVVALESTGTVVDPSNNTLKRLPTIPLK
jgi:clan AA aspartic protease